MQRNTLTFTVLLLCIGLSGLAIAQGPTLIGTIEGTPAEDKNFGDEPKNLAIGDVNGDTFTDLVVGGRGYGNIRIYLGTDVGIDGTADLTIGFPDSLTNASWFAHTVGVGDLNDDGYDDVVSGAPWTVVNDTSNVGQVYVYYGGDPMDNEYDLKIDCPHPFKTNTWFGKGLVVGNFTTDGLAGLFVAATRASVYGNSPYPFPGNYYDSVNETYNGILYFYSGGEGFDGNHDMLPILGQTSSGQAGDRALDVGDTDGDGWDDLLLGEHGASYNDDNPYDQSGMVTIYEGGQYFDHAPDIVIPKQDPQGLEFFGESLANAGDINGDGYDDIVVGTNEWASGLDKGRVYVFYGPQRSLDADLIIYAPEEVPTELSLKWGAYSGVAGLGDINDDGYDDFLVNGDDENSLDGKAYIFLGGENPGSYLTMDGEVGSFSLFGRAGIALGDINGDEINDFAISAPGFGGAAASGKIYFYAGSTDITTDMAALNPNVIESFSLSQNYPNPFNPVTTIQFELSKPGNVTLRIFNSLGQQVKTLIDQDMKIGEHQVQWDGKDSSGNKVSTGVYYYRIKTDTHEMAKKMMLLK